MVVVSIRNFQLYQVLSLTEKLKELILLNQVPNMRLENILVLILLEMVKVVKQHGGAVFGSPQGIELKISKLRELK